MCPNSKAEGIINEFKQIAQHKAIVLTKDFLQEPEDIEFLSAYQYHYQQRIKLVEDDMLYELKAYDDHHKLVCLKLSIEKMRIDVRNMKIKNQNGDSLPQALFLCCKKLDRAQRNINAIIHKIHDFQYVLGDIECLRQRKVHTIQSKASLTEDYFPSITDVEILCRLERWHDDVVAEQFDKNEKKKSPICLNHDTKSYEQKEGGHDQSFSMGLFRRILNEVKDLSSQTRKILKNSVLDCIHLGPRKHDKFDHILKAFEYIAKSDEIRSSYIEFSVSNDFIDIRFEEVVVKSISELIKNSIQDKFSSFVYGAADDNMSGLDAILGAGTHALLDFKDFSTDVQCYFPKKYDLKSMYRKHFEECVVPQVVGLYCRETKNLIVQEIFRLNGFIEHFTLQMNMIDPKNHKNSQLELHRKSLILAYKKKVKHQIKDWFSNIMTREKAIYQNVEGLYVSDDPQDIFMTFDTQLSVAKENLSQNIIPDVNLLFLDELCELNKVMKTNLESTFQKIEIEVLTSTINDLYIMNEKIESFFLNNETKHDTKYSEKVDSLCVQSLEIALYATERLVDRLFEDVDDSIFPRILSDGWVKGEPVLETIIVTLEDYLGDLKLWLQPFFYLKCLKMCFHHILQQYIEACFCLRKHRSCNGLLISHRITLDRLYIIQGLERNINSGKEKARMIHNCDIFSSLSTLMVVNSEKDAHTHICTILKCLPLPYGQSAVLQFMALRKDISESDLINWRRIVEESTQHNFYRSSCRNDAIEYNLPFGEDLNAEFRNIPPVKILETPQNEKGLSDTRSMNNSQQILAINSVTQTKSKNRFGSSKKKFSSLIKSWTTGNRKSKRGFKQNMSNLHPKMNLSLSQVKVKLNF